MVPRGWGGSGEEGLACGAHGPRHQGNCHEIGVVECVHTPEISNLRFKDLILRWQEWDKLFPCFPAGLCVHSTVTSKWSGSHIAEARCKESVARVLATAS